MSWSVTLEHETVPRGAREGEDTHVQHYERTGRQTIAITRGYDVVFCHEFGPESQQLASDLYMALGAFVREANTLSRVRELEDEVEELKAAILSMQP